MCTVPQVAGIMQTVLGPLAAQIARASGFVQRMSKMGGSEFVSTLVFGWMANPEATLEELAQMAASLGVCISPQGIDQRFTPEAAAFLKDLLDAAVSEVVAATPAAVPLLQRFQGVYVPDSSAIALPDALASVWAGCGNGASPHMAGLKFQVCLNLSTGELRGPALQDGRTHDRCSPFQRAPLPAGALRIADLGFFTLDVLKSIADQGVYWISRLQAQTVVYDDKGQLQELARLLESQKTHEVDIQVSIGQAHRLPCRLVARRVSQEVADARRRKLHSEARRRGQVVGAARLRLAEWTVYVTNVPVEKLSVEEVFVLARARWQVELLFRLWKSHGHVDKSRSEKPWRILCEVYAKLLAMVVEHWLLLVSCWEHPDRSLCKAVKTIQRHAGHLASHLKSMEHLAEAISVIQRCLAVGCRINKSRASPRTFQLLLDATKGGLT